MPSEPKTDREHLEALVAAEENIVQIAGDGEPMVTYSDLHTTIAAAKQHLASPESYGAAGALTEDVEEFLWKVGRFEVVVYGEGEEGDIYGIVAHPHGRFPKDAANPYCTGVAEAINEMVARGLGTPTPSPPTPPTEGGAEGPVLTEQNDGFLVAGKPVFTEFGYDPSDLSKSDRDLLDAVATAAYAAGASTRRPAGDDGPCQHATTDDLYEAEAFIRNNGGSHELAYKLECLALDIDEGRCPASTRGSGEAAPLEVPAVYELPSKWEIIAAELNDTLSTEAAESFLRCARELRNHLAQNPSRGSDGLEEAAKHLEPAMDAAAEALKIIADNVPDNALSMEKWRELEQHIDVINAVDLHPFKVALAAHLDQHNRKDG